MKLWQSNQGRQAACPHALRILDEVTAGLCTIGDQHSRVMSIGIRAHYFDTYDFEVVVEVAPGASVAVRYGAVDEEDRAGDPEDRDGGAVAHLVVRTMGELLLMGADSLADILHGMRMRTRQILADWAADGIHVDLLDIRLIRNEYHPHTGDLPIEIALLGLDRRLRTAIMSETIFHPDLLDNALVKLRLVLDRRYAVHRALSKQGADGLVDQLVVNAIATHMDVGAALRQISSGVWPDLPRSLTVFDEDARIRCHGSDPILTDFEWNRDTVTVSGMTLPATVLAAMCGRPITELVAHAVLSDDMTILDASSYSDEFGHSIEVTFDQPRLAFCGASGRTWQLDPALGTVPGIGGSDDGLG